MRITYFAPDLSDAAVAQRVRMLRAGGADVKLLGFRRRPDLVTSVEGVPAVDFGRTYQARFLHRTANTIRRSVEGIRWRRMIEDADVIMARNLEMWTIANAARFSAGRQIPLVYECLDVHNLMSGSGLPSKLLRRWETHALRRSTALVVSSPGFLHNYFEALGVPLPPVLLVENKRVLIDVDDRSQFAAPAAGPPWRIGWCGLIRCIESFGILTDLARRHPNLVDIQLRGRPTLKLQALIDRHLPLPNMRFGGPYSQSELASVYHGCHLNWAIDYTERGLNSNWLLPNRIYEGSYFNTPAIALADTETANWLRQRGAGVLMNDPATELDSFVTNLTAARYHELRRTASLIPTADLVHTVEDCQRLTKRIMHPDN